LKRCIDYLQTRLYLRIQKKAVQVVNLGRKVISYLVDGILYYENSDVPDRRRIAVPQHLRQQILEENYDVAFASHFSAKKLKKKLDLLY